MRSYLARSPYNVVHLTLPDSPAEAAADLAAWRLGGRARAATEAYWWVAQDYTGPDGVARTREGFAAVVEVTPYEAGQVLPHERTHAGPKEGRLRLLRATSTQLEPIFLLYDADAPFSPAGRRPAAGRQEGGVRTRVWPIDAPARSTIDTPLLIADGHHRYETAVAFRAEDRARPTRSRSSSRRGRPGSRSFRPTGSCSASATCPATRSTGPGAGVTLYRDGRYLRVATGDDFGPRVVESFAPEGVSYTAYADEAIAAVDRGDAAAAFLLQPVTVEQVAAFAHEGETMPQKSTFFFPKLTSGPAALPGGRMTPDWLDALPCGARRRARRARSDAGAGRARAGRRRRRGRRRDDGDRRGGRAVILARFRGEDVRIVSEEVGVVGDGRWTVVVDPIDGSLNAKRGIPFFSISIAVADGDTMDDVFFGYVYDFGASEEWTATRGGGAFLNGVPITERPKDELEILSFEATTTAYVSENAARFDGRRPPAARDGLARHHALPPGRGARRRGRLAEARALGRHRRRAAARPRTGPRDRPARRPAVRRGPARPRGTFARRRGGNDADVRQARDALRD